MTMKGIWLPHSLLLSFSYKTGDLAHRVTGYNDSRFMFVRYPAGFMDMNMGVGGHGLIRGNLSL